LDDDPAVENPLGEHPVEAVGIAAGVSCGVTYGVIDSLLPEYPPGSVSI